jgi:hypothetical protein
MDRLKEKIFPFLYSKRSQNFSMPNCNFNIQKSREATARVVMWKEFHLINSFTLECSFCGPSMTDNKNPFNDCHFNISLLKELGRDFCKTLLDYARDENKVKLALAELELLSPTNNTVKL